MAGVEQGGQRVSDGGRCVGHSWLDRLSDRSNRLSDVPWGVLLLALVIGLVAFHVMSGDDARGLATAAGLLGIGHGIHSGAKNLRR